MGPKLRYRRPEESGLKALQRIDAAPQATERLAMHVEVPLSGVSPTNTSYENGA